LGRVCFGEEEDGGTDGERRTRHHAKEESERERERERETELGKRSGSNSE